MSLPNYHHINLKNDGFEELTSILSSELNLRHPAVINLKSLEFDQQRETIGLIENHFVSNNSSYLFPYPIYIITEHEKSISGLPLIRNTDELPKFFLEREGKMNIKESHVAEKNKLLQQEIQNSDPEIYNTQIKNFTQQHKEISLLEEERFFYRSLLNRLTKAENG